MDIVAWKTLSRLLEQAFDLPSSERLAFVDRLDAEFDALKPRLREMLAQHDSEGLAGFLETLPKWHVDETSPPATVP